jgi:RNA polymerase sigma-54 factor
MALAQRLELRQTQSLVMTPQLQQAIKLLQLSNLELTAFVEQELERNPLLERDESAETPSEPREAPAAQEADEGVIAADTKMTGDAVSSDSDLDTDLANVYGEDSSAERAGAAAAQDPALANWSAVRGTGSGGESEDFNLEEVLTRERGLREHLTEQLSVALHDPAERLIGVHLIDLIDDAGYVREDLQSIAERLECPLAEVEAVLKVLQTFDPSGIMARSLPECLALQLKEKDRLDPAMARLLENLELVARRDHAQLMKICGVDAEDLAGMIEDLTRCNPKPGLAFGGEPVQPIVPDVFVREGPDGGWIVELNSETLPRVLVNSRYYAEVSRGASREEKVYLSDCLNNANWLVKSLDQRARTILKVAREIVRQQDAFLAKGIQYLRPLNLRTIADAIQMHESTVSRVTANKYVSTKRGLFEMKFFFTSAIASVGGEEAHSAEAVRHRIRALIDEETADGILSDDRIVEILREAGIDIARRTVAKYREAMRIPSSVQRRRDRKHAP